VLGGVGSDRVEGDPLLVSPAIADGIVWSFPRSRIITALRLGTTVVTDSSAYFSSDRTAVRAIVRLSFGFIDPASITKITKTSEAQSNW
jgi:hypothetical protein